MTQLNARFCGSTALPGPSVHFRKSSLFLDTHVNDVCLSRLSPWLGSIFSQIPCRILVKN